MRLKFQADADLNPVIAEGLRKKKPSIDYRIAQGVIPDGMPDFDVLWLAAASGRVVVSKDLKTMQTAFKRFTAKRDSPGLILIPSTRSLAQMIEGLISAWREWSPAALRNQFRWLK